MRRHRPCTLISPDITTRNVAATTSGDAVSRNRRRHVACEQPVLHCRVGVTA